jgi:aspartyl/glutamyl-tRNA(Asn/Gln) amidotransferase C subunit
MLERKDIDNLANLARIALSEAEKDKLQKDMESILGYIGELQKAPSFAEASEGKPGNHYLRNVMREDVEPFEAGANTEAILSQAPKRRGDYFVVKKILGDSIS